MRARLRRQQRLQKIWDGRARRRGAPGGRLGGQLLQQRGERGDARELLAVLRGGQVRQAQQRTQQRAARAARCARAARRRRLRLALHLGKQNPPTLS
jgi:hypothetical protein